MVDVISQFGDLVLGKGIVVAKDTPNFIANRIGVFTTLDVLRIMQEDGYTIEEIDTLTGPVLGMPKSATFRTLDIIGLDVMAHVVKNLRESLPQDECHALFQVPGFVEQMIQRGLLGDKTGQGFYKKVKGQGGDGERDSDPRPLNVRVPRPPARHLSLFGDGAKCGRSARARQDTFPGARSGRPILSQVVFRHLPLRRHARAGDFR